MTLLDREAPPLSPPSPAAAAPTGVRAWARDLALGTRLAVSGGREGWARTALTALGVGIGVALLLAAAAVPQLLDARESRTQARDTTNAGSQKPGEGVTDSTFLWAEASTEYGRTALLHGQFDAHRRRRRHPIVRLRRQGIRPHRSIRCSWCWSS